MNSLSWFIYATQLVDAVTTVFIWASILTAVAFIARVVTTVVRAESAWINAPSANGADQKARAEVWSRFDAKTGIFAAVFLVCVAIASAVPSRQTMLLIASSEIGERLVRSDAVAEIVNPGADLLKTWIKNETARLAKEAAK